MKVFGQNDPILKLQRTTSVSSKAGKFDMPESGSAAQISGAAADLAAIEDEMKGIPEVRQSKVAEIGNAIREGRYKIDEDKLAEVLSNFI